jgi:hypothetical protein
MRVITGVEMVRARLAAGGSGFEPSVPRKAPVVVLVSVLVRADFSVSRESSGGDMTPLEISLASRRYQRFESGFLQRRVQSEPDFGS